MEIIKTSIETNLTSLGYGIINENIQNEAIEEQKKQQNSDCYDDQCLVDTGRMLAAKKLLIIKISNKDNDKFFIKLRKIDIETGIIEDSFASKNSLNFNDYDNLNITIQKLLNKIFTYKAKSNDSNVVIPFRNPETQRKTKTIQINSNVKEVSVYSDKSLFPYYRLGVTPLELKLNTKSRFIYLLKYGYLFKEYEVKYNDTDKINITLDEAPKYQLTINTKTNYKISYTPLLDKSINSYYSQIKYFDNNTRSINLPQGKYRLVLSKKGFSTVYKEVNLSKDTVIDIKDKKELFLFGGIELLSEYKLFLVDDTTENHFHSGFILTLLSFITKDFKIDFMRFGFLTDFKSVNSLKDIKFSFLNMEIFASNNLYFSFLLGYMLGDGDMMFNIDQDSSFTAIIPMGVKMGYKFNLIDDLLAFKIYQKVDWLIYAKEFDTKHGLSLTTGITLEYLFN
jgi:hypothetical protein